MKVFLAASFVFLATCGRASSFDINEHRITSTMAAVYTPMKGPAARELDLDVIPAYAQLMKARNITNVMPAGSNGEAVSLSVSERKALAEAWAKVAPANGIKVYMHVGGESLTDSRELMAHAASTPGIVGAVAMTPVYFKPTLETLHDFLAEVAAAAPEMPFWYYHFPDLTQVLPGKIHTLLEMVDTTGKIPNFMGIKYTDYNFLDFSLLHQFKNGKYNLLYGRDEQVLSALDLGAEAAVSSTVNYSPTLREAIHLYDLGQRKEAFEKQAENVRMCSLFSQYESQAKNVQKSILKMSGLDVGPSRLPKTDLSTTEYADLQKQLEDLDFIDLPLKESRLDAMVV